jgi:hypothetical protein
MGRQCKAGRCDTERRQLDAAGVMWNPTRITASLLTDGQRFCSPPRPHVGSVTDGQRFSAARGTPSAATTPDANSLTDGQRDRVAGVDLVADGHRDPVPSQQVWSCERKR